MTRRGFRKYGNRKCVLDGKKFDSQDEADRWLVLLEMQRRREITDLERQVTFVLVDRKKVGKRTLRAVKYTADFVYLEAGRKIAEDVKGVKTPVFSLKARLFAERYPEIELRIVPAGGGRRRRSR